MGSTSLKLYDSQGNLIEQRTNTGLGIFRFTVEGLPVTKWRLEPVGDEPAGFAIDNVCFSLQTVKRSPRRYPEYLRQGDTLENVPDTDFPESERPLPEYVIPPVSQSQDEGEYVNPEQIPDLQPSQDSTPLSSDATPVIGPGTVADLSCEGIGTPLTERRLVELARDRAAREGYPEPNEDRIRQLFEAFTLDSQRLPKYNGPAFKSPERYKKTLRYRKRGALGGVEPEAATISRVILADPNGYGPPQVIDYPDSVFWDAKSIREGKKIELKTGEYQTQGYLDYLSHYSSAARATLPKNIHPTPYLIYMTTSNVGITRGVRNYTGSETPDQPFTPVALYHMIACELNTNGDYSRPYLQMGRGIPLNTYLFTGYPTEAFVPLPAGRPSSLTF